MDLRGANECFSREGDVCHTKCRRPCLTDLPDEMLEKIASCLDSDSVVAFASTNCRLNRACRMWVTSMRLRRVTANSVRFLRVNGSHVQRLDLSSCKSSSVDLEASIRGCPNILELNVINSNFRSLDVLSHLRRLETLCMTAPNDRGHSLLSFFGHFPPIKKLYLDVGPREEALVFTIRLLNFCELIEFVQINLYGSQYAVGIDSMPAMNAERWKTLRTVVCTCHMSDGNFARVLLECIFAFNTIPGLREWRNQRRECYIYEDGCFNESHPYQFEPNDNIRLLREYHDLRLTSDENVKRIFESPYGSPRAIRIRGFYVLPRTLSGNPSTTVTELDLTRCHGNFTESFRLNLIALSPSLEFFACSLCFLLAERTRGFEDVDASPEQRRLRDSLARLKLRKLSVKGVAHIGNCSESCPCGYDGWDKCQTCYFGVKLTKSNFVDFSEFDHLEQLTLSGVSFHHSAYGYIANPNLRVARLCFNNNNSYSNLERFIGPCGKLQQLKLEGFDLPTWSKEFWIALCRARQLKQLCLRTDQLGLASRELREDLIDHFVEVAERVDFMHVHGADREFREVLRSRKGIAFADDRLERSNHYDFNTFCSRDIRYSTVDSSFMGRALCLADCSVGVIPSPGWELTF